MATRGIKAIEFTTNDLWLHGPNWIINSFESHISMSVNALNDISIPELHKPKNHALLINLNISILTRYLF